MFFRKKKQAEKPTAPTTQEVAPNGIQKMVFMGPTTHKNFRIVVFHNGSHTHFYMTSRGDLYIPPKHSPETLQDSQDGWREWNWAKNNWTESNVPKKVTDPKMWKNALRAMGQIANIRRTRKMLEQKNSNELPKLGFIGALAEIKEKLQQEEGIS